MNAPNRWMHLRCSTPFSEAQFQIFRANADVFQAYATALLRNLRSYPSFADHPPTEYEFFPAEISADRKTMTLPLGGPQTLETRAKIENMASFLLWHALPQDLLEQIQEGLTETIDKSRGPVTSWRDLVGAILLRPPTTK